MNREFNKSREGSSFSLEMTISKAIILLASVHLVVEEPAGILSEVLLGGGGQYFLWSSLEYCFFMPGVRQVNTRISVNNFEHNPKKQMKNIDLTSGRLRQSKYF